MNQEIKLARKNYNHEFNFQEYNPQDFEGQEIACENCGVVSSDDSWKYDPKYNWLKELKWCRCSNNCERYFCNHCVVNAEFLSRHKYAPKNGQWELEDAELFIDQGKWCRECIFNAVGEANIWAALKQNEELVISTLEEE